MILLLAFIQRLKHVGFPARIYKKTFEKHINELKKCKVLCANCHMTEHINTKQFNELKQDIYKKISNIQ